MSPGSPLRFAVAFICGLVVSFLLFWLMEGMIVVADRAPSPANPPAMLEKISLRPLAPPAPVTTEEAPATAPPVGSASRAPGLPAIPAPEAGPIAAVPVFSAPLNLRGAPAGVADGVGFGAAASGVLSTEAGWEDDFDGRKTVPIASVRPRYPAVAAKSGIEGWVEMVFTIGSDGRVTEIRVITAQPPGVFEEAAAAALAKWLYAPLYVSGRRVTRQATQRFEFTRADIDALHLFER